MLAGVRGAMVIAAGTIRYNFVLFLIADGLGAIVSGGLFMAIGYFFGRQFGDLEELRKKVEHYQLRIFIGLGVLVLLFLFWRWLRKKLGGAPVIDKAMGSVVHKAEESEKPKPEKSTDPTVSPTDPTVDPDGKSEKPPTPGQTPNDETRNPKSESNPNDE